MNARCGVGLALAAALAVGLLAVDPVLAGAPFPDPVFDQAVYDEAEILDPATEAALEARIDALEVRSGAEVVIYLQVDPFQDFDSNLAAAESLMNQWGIGRQGFDDGFVILVSFQDDRVHGVLSTYAGSGFKAAYLSGDEQTELRDAVMVPFFQSERVGDGLLAAMEVIEDEVTADATASLDTYRMVNAVVGIPGAALVLLATAGTAVFQWRRHGDDPDLVDSPSVLMAGPPADMTPPLATVLREGRATGNALRTMLVQLAGMGLIRFRNIDRAGKVKRDDAPDPETDPAIDLPDPPLDQAAPEGPLASAYRELVGRGGSSRTLSRESLWGVNEGLDPLKRELEREVVRLGWLERLPTPVIVKW
ncbi:MAG TPA: TPM domain-containing protein, partial [Candidatus Limnocylindria bacterium]|nr:TPM domain-containing protein [Candidatus Limnocylindria bacterium]